MEIEFTRPSSSGQVLIPKAIRKELGITPKDRFLVFGKDDTIVFKRIEKSVIEKSFEEIAKPLRRAAKKVGFGRKELERVIKEVRKAERK